MSKSKNTRKTKTLNKNNSAPGDKLFKDLTNEQKKIITTKSVSASKTADEWLALLRDIALFDDKTNASLKKAGIVSGCFFLFFSIFLIIPLLIFKQYIIAVTLPSLSILYIIFLSIKRKKLLKMDISNQLGEFVIPFIELIKDDIKNTASIDMSLKLHRTTTGTPTHSEKNKSRDYPKINTKHFQNSWLELNTVLADKTRISLNIVDNTRELRVTKKNPRGKIKVKIKHKTRRLISSYISFNNSNYNADTSLLNNENYKISIKEKETSSSIKLQFLDKINGYKTVPTDQVFELIGAGLNLLSSKKEN